MITVIIVQSAERRVMLGTGACVGGWRHVTKAWLESYWP